MKLEALRHFCAVVETGSFRAAADRVHRSQPAVSQQVKALEREFGHVLIERATCRPTPMGRQFYDRAARLLREAEGIEREMADFDEAQAQALRVGTSDTTALYVLPPVVRAFSDAMPRTRLVLINRPSEAIARQVARGELDLGIVTLPVSREDLEEQELFRQGLVLVVPSRHRLAGRRTIRLRELSGEPLLLLDAETRTGGLIAAHFRQEGFEPRVAMDSGSFEVIKRYVAQGVGLSFLPRAVITPEDAGLAIIEAPNLPLIHIGAIWRRGAYLTRAAQAFLTLATETAAKP